MLFACFGKEDAGIQAYRTFIEEAPFAPVEETPVISYDRFNRKRNISNQIYRIYSRYKWHENYYNLSDNTFIDFPSHVLPFSPECLLTLARDATNRPDGDLVLYLCLQPWFMLVRVLYRTQDGWADAMEDKNCCITEENRLLLHAYAELLLSDMPNGGLAHWNGTAILCSTDGEITVSILADTRTREELSAAFGKIFDTTECEAMIPQFLQWKQDLA